MDKINFENAINAVSILINHVDQDSDIHVGLKDVLRMLNNDKINYGRDEFMEFFRSDDFHEKMGVPDCLEVFSQVLHGGSDFTKELLVSTTSDYDVDINAVLGFDDYEMIAEENKLFGQFLERLGYTEQQISDIANSGGLRENTTIAERTPEETYREGMHDHDNDGFLLDVLMDNLNKKERMETLDSMFNAYNSGRDDAMVSHFSDLWLPLEGLKRALLDLQKDGKYIEVSDKDFANICEKITLASEYLYFLIPYTDMERLGIKEGDSEHQIAKALSGKDDCLYSEDMIRDFHHLDLNILFPEEIPFLSDPAANGLIVEWDVAGGQSIDIWYGTFAEHSGVKAITSLTAWKNTNIIQAALNDEAIKHIASQAPKGTNLEDAARAVNKSILQDLKQ